MTDVLIIGAGCAGLTAAIYCARAGKTVTILEQETIGGQISVSPRVENYPGIPAITGLAFSDALYEQAMALGVKLELETAVELIPGTPHTLRTEGETYQANAVILATGAGHRHLGVEREKDFFGSGLSYCAVCDGAFFKELDVAVVGGGSTALQSAAQLSGICRQVHLIHRRDQFRGEAHLVQRVEALANVTLHLGRQVTALEGSDRLTGAVLDDGTVLPLQGLFVCVGQVPNTNFLKGVVALNPEGFIQGGENCRTDIPGVFAAGDCRTKEIRQLTTAAADGTVAALGACSN